MKYYYIRPETAGGEGPRSIVDRSVHPPIVSFLEFEIEGWLGDELLAGFPCFIATLPLEAEIKANNLTGVRFLPVEITRSDYLDDRQPEVVLPPFVRLDPFGIAGHDDFGVAPDLHLVISETALKVLQSRSLNHADVEEYAPGKPMTRLLG